MQNTKAAAAFVAAQKAFAPATKSSTNPHFKSKYADLAACVEAVLDALNEQDLALMQVCHETESGVLVETIFLHSSGESISGGKLHVPSAKNDPQGYGSALTYARRYSLMAACGIAPEDDDGNAASRTPAKAAKPAASLPAVDGEAWEEFAAMCIKGFRTGRTLDAAIAFGAAKYTLSQSQKDEMKALHDQHAPIDVMGADEETNEQNQG